MNRPDQRRPAPPTYKILPGGGRIEADPLRDRAHDRIDLGRITGSYTLRIITVSPLHVGSGVSNIWHDRAGHRFLAREIVTNRDGDREVPVIPGASIKGAVRNLVEAFGGGCQLDQKYCDPPCRVCAIFGHLQAKGGYLARAAFDEARPETPADADRVDLSNGPIPWEPDRMRPRGRRIYGKPPEIAERPVPYVVVDKQTAFTTRLVLRNITEEELGLVLLGLGADDTFELRLGGGKFAGFGRVRVQVAGASLRRGYESLAPEILDAETALARAKAAMEAAERGLKPSGARSLATLRAVLGAVP